MSKYICSVEERVFGSFLVEANSKDEAQMIAGKVLKNVSSIFDVYNIQIDDELEMEYIVQ